MGLAAARALARSGREVVILEAETLIGSGISSRNSEVIHAGIYYPQGSLKARLCVEGKRLLYGYCETRNIAHRRCGKLIVATEPERVTELTNLQNAAQANGVEDVLLLEGAEARALEPSLACVAALHSPSTGIVDSHAFMLSLLGEAQDAGAMIAYGTLVRKLELSAEGVAITLAPDPIPTLKARIVVNATGLTAPDLAATLGSGPPPPKPFYAKGSYFTVTGKSPFKRLIYPTPEPGGLGIHLTIDLGGQARFGPDVEWIDHPDYDVQASRADRFYTAIRRYWPDLADNSLIPAYAGVRPKLSGPGEPAADFRIDCFPAGSGALVNLLGIESPGLTASLAIADEVERQIGQVLDA